MQAPVIDQWMVDAFGDAVEGFTRRLEYPDQIDLRTAQSIDDVYKETARLQNLQSQTRTLRASKRLKPYLDFLAQYESTIEVFIQVKPDILALIWGPLKLILRAFDKTLEVLGSAGQILPDLHAWASVFPTNLRVRRVLCLFYEDILDLHLTLLNLFGRKKWDLFFEAFWPKTADVLSQIQGRMTKHKHLLTDEVTLENIIQARNVRVREDEESRQIRERDDHELFRRLLADLRINMYDSELEALLRQKSSTLDDWLRENKDYKMWSTSREQRRLSIWLQGIPGAGKSVLCAKIARHLQNNSQRVLFAFLAYNDYEHSRPLKVFQSLMFQLLSKEPSLAPVIRDAYIRHYRELTGSEEFVNNLFLDLVRDQGMIHIVIDGLDEVAEENSRLFLARSLLEITTACHNVRLLISCRNEYCLDKELRYCDLKIRVDHHNEPEILAYLDREEKILVSQWKELGAQDSVLAEVKFGRDFIAVHSNGMMLYAKLMVEILKSLDNPDEIHDELQCLPDGLDQAYARILEKIENSPPRTSFAAEKILQWLTCASESQPLRVNEILQAMIVERGSQDFRKIKKALRDLRQTCGPILEIEGDQVRLVHFSAKEYIFNGRGRFLKIVDSNQEIASTILTYLSFDSFRTIFSDTWDENDVKEKIRSQDFILFDESACLFEKIGFQTSRDLQLHVESHHETMTASPSMVPSTTSMSISNQDWVLIATDAIQRDDLELLREFPYSARIDNISVLVDFAAKRGSKDALHVIWEEWEVIKSPDEPSPFANATNEAVIGENIDTLRFCLKNDFASITNRGIYGTIPLVNAILGGNAQVIECFLQSGVEPWEIDYERPSLRHFEASTIFELQGTRLDEYMATVQKYDMPMSMRQYTFACAVDMNAMQLANAFLQFGANVNDSCIPPRGQIRAMAYLKPLAIAADKGLSDMVVFLLQNGAEPDAADEDCRRGINQIEKQMGMVWDEIVEQYGSNDGS
ncbi:hypothetical protein PG985_008306 [Apiospora marii]|uniref:NACHT domain-containing protein n=1 Tax=Apiospora marii TaxID=335849 RepID=A0ABR1SRK1_9PEZI